MGEALAGDREKAIRIDEWMVELQPLWAALETDCVAACCGLDAFVFWPEAIQNNTRHLPKAPLIAQLKIFQNKIENIYGNDLVSFRLNSYFTKNTLLHFLAYLIGVLSAEH